MHFAKYETRFKAGELLANFVLKKSNSFKNLSLEEKDKFFCFAIPNGGVSVTEGFCSRLEIAYDILIVRKIKIPYNTEAGFGSITTDGTILINQQLLRRLNLSEEAINKSIDLTKNEINERLKFYKKNINLENFYKKKIENQNIFILDDGLASGYTMLAAIKMIKKYSPKQIFIAVPTAPSRTIVLIEKKVDYIFCPNVRDVLWFAVADSYKNWYDVPESEVIEILKNSQFYFEKFMD
ncbi:MAG: phosphoribosyltransferase [Candidatus Thorarchaeota archaeon]